LSAPYDTILSLDFETRWNSKNYTLSKITTEEYIRNEFFERLDAASMSTAADNLLNGYEEMTYLNTFLESTGDEPPCLRITHSSTYPYARGGTASAPPLSSTHYQWHALFAAWRLAIVSPDLQKILVFPKGKAVHSTDGLDEIAPAIEAELAAYCKHDVYLCEEIFKRLVKGYPASELRLIDLTLKMYTEPVLQLDKLMLANAIEEEREMREELLGRLGVTDATLAE
jgi:DNA polymerase